MATCKKMVQGDNGTRRHLLGYMCMVCFLIIKFTKEKF